MRACKITPREMFPYAGAMPQNVLIFKNHFEDRERGRTGEWIAAQG